MSRREKLWGRLVCVGHKETEPNLKVDLCSQEVRREKRSGEEASRLRAYRGDPLSLEARERETLLCANSVRKRENKTSWIRSVEASQPQASPHASRLHRASATSTARATTAATTAAATTAARRQGDY